MFGTLNRRVVRMLANVSKEHITSIFRVENQPSQIAASRYAEVNGGNTFPGNIGSQPDYTVLYPRRWQHS
jgi:hypothetical protein